MNKVAAHHIRSFAMSGMLISEELKNVEAEFGISLDHIHDIREDDQSQYYPQFEQAVRVEAAKMSEHYEVFYCLESSIRKLLAGSMVDAEGASWWASERVPDRIRQDVESRLKREIDNGVTRRSDDLIDYTNFGELSVIITRNWDVFGTIFNSKRAVEKVMKDLNLLRGPIAHCCPMTDDEIDRLRLAVKDWFRMMA